MYSVTSRPTFNRLEGFRQSMRRVKRGDLIFMLVGNKCDQVQEREVSKEEGAALAKHFGCEFLETSCKTTENVERVFTNLVRELWQMKGIKVYPLPTSKRKKDEINESQSQSWRCHRASALLCRRFNFLWDYYWFLPISVIYQYHI